MYKAATSGVDSAPFVQSILKIYGGGDDSTLTVEEDYSGYTSSEVEGLGEDEIVVQDDDNHEPLNLVISTNKPNKQFSSPMLFTKDILEVIEK